MRRQTPRLMPFVRSCVAFSAVGLSACTVGPDYHPPETQAPAQWKDASLWHVGQPSHAALSLTWWQDFNDPVLNSLETRGLQENQTLASVSAQCYRTPSEWRRVADQNGINDPRRLTPGTILQVPPILS